MWNLLIRITAPVCSLGTCLLLVACTNPSRADENLILSEVMAANHRTLKDQRGEHSDWIEIFNPNSNSVDVGGWFLSDDPKALDKWRFPAAKIKGNGYLIVFASERDRRSPEGELHTNFRLGSKGGFLALVKPDGQTISSQFAPGYPAQVSDVSFGVEAAWLNAPHPAAASNAAPSGSILPSTHLRFFPTPTPGSANKGGVTGFAPPPKFTTAPGVFPRSVSVELTAPSSGGTIRYTIDGSEPNPSSAAYTGPIDLAVTAAVKARVFERDLAPSATAVQTYTIADESVASFSSNLPLVIIDTLGQRIGRDTRTPVTMRFIDAPAGKRSHLTGPADFDGSARIHHRGYTSLKQPKKSYTVKTTDEAGEGLKVPILGLPKESDWVLYAPYPDKTLMRDVLAYELSNKMGRYAPRTRFVEVFVTRAGAKLTRRDYAGVYVFEEKIKRGPQRVNITGLTPSDNTEPNITGGYIFKKDHEDKGESGFRTSQGNEFYYVEPKAEAITPAQRAWLKAHLNKFERALYGASFKDASRGYPAFLDADSFIDHFWLVEVTKNIDGFRFSAFFQIDRGGKIKLEPPWDWNLSFGNAQGRGGYNPTGWYHDTLDDQQYSWYRRLFEDPDFTQKQIDRWAELRKDLFAPENLLQRVNAMASHLKEAQERNFERWPILGEQVWPNWYVGETYEDEVNYMKKWIQRRIAWLDGRFPTTPSITRKDDTATINSRGGKTYFTLDGSDPRLPGGAISTKAQVYSSAVNLKADTKIVARVQNGNVWSAPARLGGGSDGRR